MYHKFEIIAIGFEKNPEKTGFFVKLLNFSVFKSIIGGLFLEKLSNSLKISRILHYSQNLSFGKFAVSEHTFQRIAKLFNLKLGIEDAKAYSDRAAVGRAECLVSEGSAVVAGAKTEALV